MVSQTEIAMPATRKNFTDNLIKNLRPAAPGNRYSLSDAQCPGLKIRVTSRGTKSFVLWRRFPPAKHPAARALGVWVLITRSLRQARSR